ncbi:MAG: C40 family peptidase [Muribaculaceae bacterium]|nr:C40 family peptidase [Muribaculaceae bacterium]MDE6533603.1 C40 family peptidase [Muribaculaceae bacterium]
MKLRNIASIFLMSVGLLSANAEHQTTTTIKTDEPASGLSVHQAAHKRQLANARMRMDKSVIKDFIKKDVERREAEEIPGDELSAESSAMVKDLLSEARKHIGKRYRSGGKGPAAFDCSGFSSYVYRQFGYELSGSSRDQYNQGEKVGRHELREGDLVFFTGRNSKRGVVGHVGIVVSADNEKGTFQFIHASTSGGIRIDGCGGYYAKRYLGARRVITK